MAFVYRGAGGGMIYNNNNNNNMMSPSGNSYSPGSSSGSSSGSGSEDSSSFDSDDEYADDGNAMNMNMNMNTRYNNNKNKNTAAVIGTSSSSSMVRKQLFRDSSASSSAVTPRNLYNNNNAFYPQKHGSGGGKHMNMHSSYTNTPSTVPMSQYSPSSSIMTPNSMAIANMGVPKMPQMPPPAQVSCGTKTNNNNVNDTTRALAATPGSLAAALGMYVDTSRNAAPIREPGHAPPPIQTHQGTTFVGYYNYNQSHHPNHQNHQQHGAMSPRPGSLAAALSMMVDDNQRAAPIREKDHEAPPIQSHYGTTHYSFSNNYNSMGQNNDNNNAYFNPKRMMGYSYYNEPPQQQQNSTPRGKKNLADLVFERMSEKAKMSSSPKNKSKSKNASVMPAQPGSLAAALGMKIDASYYSAPIREIGHQPPPIQTHQGTTFIGYNNNNYNTKPKKSFMDAVMSRVTVENSISSQQMQRSSPRAYNNNGYNYNQNYNNNYTYSGNNAAAAAVVPAREGSLAAALGMKIDSTNQAAPIRENGYLPPPIQTHYGTTFIGYSNMNMNTNTKKKSLMDVVMSRLQASNNYNSNNYDDDSSIDSEPNYYHTAQSTKNKNNRKHAPAKPGSLAAALGMKVDITNTAAPIRERGHQPPPIQTHQGTTFIGYAPKKKSLMDAVMSRVSSKENMFSVESDISDTDDEYQPYGTNNKKKTKPVAAAKPGSLAAALGMKVDLTNTAAPIRERGHRPPPIQTHQGTTFVGYAPKKKVFMDVVASRLRAKSKDYIESSSSSDDDNDGGYNNNNNNYYQQTSKKPTKAIVPAQPGSLAAALGMKVDAAYTAAPIREKGHRPPPTQTHQGTTFQGYQYKQSQQQNKCLADVVFSRMAAAAANNNKPSPSKKSLMDVVMSKVKIHDDDDASYTSTSTSTNNDDIASVAEVNPIMMAKPGSLAAALGMKIDVSNQAAPIRKIGHRPPPVQPYQGTTFVGKQQRQQQYPVTTPTNAATTPSSVSSASSLWMIADLTMSKRKKSSASKRR